MSLDVMTWPPGAGAGLELPLRHGGGCAGLGALGEEVEVMEVGAVSRSRRITTSSGIMHSSGGRGVVCWSTNGGPGMWSHPPNCQVKDHVDGGGVHCARK